MIRRITMTAAVMLVARFSIGANQLAYTVTPVAGHFQYDFALTNTGSSGGALFDLFVSLETPIGNIDTGSFQSPAGWGDSSGGFIFFGPDVGPNTSFVEWSAEFSGSHDLGIGSSLGGFSFQSFHPIIGPVMFALNGSTTLDTAQLVSVPEPSGDVLFISILFVMLLKRTGNFREL